MFGNAEPLAGRAAVVAGTAAFLAGVAGLRHEVTREWRVGADTVAEARVTYHRHDGTSVTLPSVSIWHARDDGLVDDYRVYVDLAPVYASPAVP